MYIKEIEIKNFMAIRTFRMSFNNPAGWHVLIGDNGSGKTSILKAIGYALGGPINTGTINSIVYDAFKDMTNSLSSILSVNLEVERQEDDSKSIQDSNSIAIRLESVQRDPHIFKYTHENTLSYEKNILNSEKSFGWFSSGFGPLRRLEDPNATWYYMPNKIVHLEIHDKYLDKGIWYKLFMENKAKSKRLVQHLSLLHDEAVFPLTVEWFNYIRKKSFEPQSSQFFHRVCLFINQGELLPGETKVLEYEGGLMFQRKDSKPISYFDLSSGSKSALCIVLELIRQMTEIFKSDNVFDETNDGFLVVNKTGVVLIDEIDAHLHPTWQTRIGQWFTKYFPKIQFIVTTHSPLICRAAEKGTIWKLEAPGSGQESKQLTGRDRDKLIYGDPVDQYDTEAFGDIPPSEKAEAMRKEMAALSLKSFRGEISRNEKKLLNELKNIFSTWSL